MWHIPKVIMEEHNFMLLKPIDMEKFQAYVKQMVNEKGILVIFLNLLTQPLWYLFPNKMEQRTLGN